MSETRTKKLRLSQGQTVRLGACLLTVVGDNRNRVEVVCEVPIHLACFVVQKDREEYGDLLQSSESTV